MAAKIFALVALLALSVSAANAYLIPQCSPAPIASIIPSYLQPLNALGFEQQAMQSYRLQQALAASTILQQPWAVQQQQSSAHLAVQNVAAVQHQQQAYSQVAVANPTTYFQQQQLLPFSQLSNPVAYLQQQQQFLPFNQIAAANPSAYWQQQQLNTQAVANAAVAAALFRQQQLNPYNQLAVTMNPAAIFQGPLVGGAIF